MFSDHTSTTTIRDHSSPKHQRIYNDIDCAASEVSSQPRSSQNYFPFFPFSLKPGVGLIYIFFYIMIKRKIKPISYYNHPVCHLQNSEDNLKRGGKNESFKNTQ